MSWFRTHLRRNPQAHRIAGRRPQSYRPLLEELEKREVLTAFATPTYVLAHPLRGASPNWSSASPSGYTPAQIRHAYGFDQITFNQGAIQGDGSGQTIAIVDAFDDPKIASDLHAFDKYFGLPDPVFTKVAQDGSTNYPTADAGWAMEITLDVEWSHAVAPGANILLVEAQDNSYTNLFAAVDYAASQPGVAVVSMSFGGPEFSGEASLDSHFVTPSGHTGVTFVASSGDQGAPVSYPAVSPNVLAVGGTSLNLDAQGNYLSESGWSGSGGGISQFESQPGYQQGVVSQSTTLRTNPDVAYDADPNTGFSVYNTFSNPANAPWSLIGGTSAGAPQWAALIAIADQGRNLAGETSLDGATQTLPMLYGLSSADFADITSGTSLGNPHYTAGAGYDLVTGLGSPVANKVVADLVGPQGNPGPSLTARGVNLTLTPGQTFNGTVAFVSDTYPGVTAADLNATIDWGDGSNPDTVALTGPDAKGYFEVAGTHTYSQRGTDTITVTIQDTVNGVTTTAQGTATVRIAPITPATPKLIAPAGSIISATPTFSWHAVTGADHYDLWVNDTSTGQSQVLRNQDVTGTSWTPATSLAQGQSYVWWLRAVGSGGSASPWSAGQSFSIAALGIPTPLSPTGLITTAQPAFSWTAVAQADHYDIWVNNLTTGQSQVLRNQQVAGTSWTPPTGLVQGDRYEWWVRAVGSSGSAGGWSAGQSFSIAALAVPTVLGPIGNTATTQPTFSWTAVDQADHYDIWVNDLTSGQSQVLRNTNATGTSWTTSTALAHGHKYEVWIRAISSTGGVSAWSTPVVFSVI
jgi:hypothetical protein